MDALTNIRHEAFCLEFVIDFNATKAAERAGYKPGDSARRIGSRLMARPDVRKRIDTLMERRREACELTASGVIERLDRLANLCLALVPRYNKDGQIEAMVPVNPSGAARALELLGKHLALFVDRSETISAEEIEIIWPEPGPVSKRDFEPAPESGVAVEI